MNAWVNYDALKEELETRIGFNNLDIVELKNDSHYNHNEIRMKKGEVDAYTDLLEWIKSNKVTIEQITDTDEWFQTYQKCVAQ